ncbi:hypothetical protein ACWGJB_39410 [Streptomyces sp. NPDC054813]
MDVADVDMTITNAVAQLDRSGDGSLGMTVRNDDGVPEHLGMVVTPGGGRGVLVGGGSRPRVTVRCPPPGSCD